MNERRVSVQRACAVVVVALATTRTPFREARADEPNGPPAPCNTALAPPQLPAPGNVRLGYEALRRRAALREQLDVASGDIPSMGVPGQASPRLGGAQERTVLDRLSDADDTVARVLVDSTVPLAARHALARSAAEAFGVVRSPRRPVLHFVDEGFDPATSGALFSFARDGGGVPGASARAAASRQRALEAVLTVAAESGPDDLRATVRSWIESPAPLPVDAAQGRYEALVDRRLREELALGRDTPLVRLSKLTAVRQLASQPAFGRSVDLPRVNRAIEALTHNPELEEQLERIRREAVRNVVGSSAFRDQVEMVRSQRFRALLALDTSEMRLDRVRRALAPIEAVDPARANALFDELVGRLAAEQLSRVGDDAWENGVERAVELHLRGSNSWAPFVKDGLKSAPDLVKRLARVIRAQNEALAATRGGQAVSAIATALEDARQLTPAQRSALRNVFGLLEGADRYGQASSIGATAGLIALGIEIRDGNAFRDWRRSSSSVATILKTADSAEAFTRAGAGIGSYLGLRSSATLARGSSLAVAVARLKFLGPVGDTITGGLDVHSAARNFALNRPGEAMLDVTSASCSFAAAGAGIALACGATGPAAPVTLAVATVTIISVKGYKYFFAEGDELTLVREMGMHADQTDTTDAPSPPTYDARHLVLTQNCLRAAPPNHCIDLSVAFGPPTPTVAQALAAAAPTSPRPGLSAEERARLADWIQSNAPPPPTAPTAPALGPREVQRARLELERNAVRPWPRVALGGRLSDLNSFATDIWYQLQAQTPSYTFAGGGVTTNYDASDGTVLNAATRTVGARGVMSDFHAILLQLPPGVTPERFLQSATEDVHDAAGNAASVRRYVEWPAGHREVGDMVELRLPLLAAEVSLPGSVQAPLFYLQVADGQPGSTLVRVVTGRSDYARHPVIGQRVWGITPVDGAAPPGFRGHEPGRQTYVLYTAALDDMSAGRIDYAASRHAAALSAQTNLWHAWLGNVGAQVRSQGGAATNWTHGVRASQPNAVRPGARVTLVPASEGNDISAFAPATRAN